MKKPAKLEDIPEPLRRMDGALVESVTTINHRPHPFTIGARHVAYAADKCFGKLGDEAIRAHPCAARGCGQSVDEHTSDCVAVVRVERDVREVDVRAWLKSIADVEVPGLDGFVLTGDGKILKAEP
jgi:hypothetical protein